MSIGGSKSSGKTTSTSNSSTQGEGYDYGTGMWSGQAPFLTDLYNRANQASYGGDPSTGYLGRAEYADNQGMEALRMGEQQLRNSQGYLGSAGGYLNRSADNLQSFLNPTTTDPLSKVYAQQMRQQFQEEFLPGLKGDAMMAGGLGGSRQQIGAALGSQRAMQAIGDFNSSLYGQQQDRALQAAQGLGTIGQMFQGLGDASNQIGAGWGNMAGGWQSAGGNAMGMADFARSMPWYGLNQYSGLLGMPVTLDQGGFNWNNSQSSSSSSGKSSSGGFNFGIK